MFILTKQLSLWVANTLMRIRYPSCLYVYFYRVVCIRINSSRNMSPGWLLLSLMRLRYSCVSSSTHLNTRIGSSGDYERQQPRNRSYVSENIYSCINYWSKIYHLALLAPSFSGLAVLNRNRATDDHNCGLKNTFPSHSHACYTSKFAVRKCIYPSLSGQYFTSVVAAFACAT